MFAASKSGSADAKDPQFNYVTMLLHGNGTNGAQNNTFVDSSTNNFTITRNGNTTQGTFSPYGSNWSNYFDGTGDDLRISSNAAFAIGTGNFTFEAWINPPSWATAAPFFVCTGTGGLWIGKNGSNFVVRAYGVADQLQYATVPTTNVWTHIVAVRSGTTLSLFYNGTRVATTTNSYSFAQQPVSIGSDGEPVAPTYYTGYISNLRLVKGTAVYDPTASTLTVPTTPLTAITNTSLLTCQSNRFIDNSTNNFTITKNGDVSVQRFSPFSPTTAYSTSVIGGSGYFDGSGDKLTVAANTAFQFGTGNFTVEFWLYPTSLSSYQTPIDMGYNSSGSYVVQTGNANGIPVFYSAGIALLTSSSAWNANAFNHVVVCRSGTTLSMFINGARTATATNSTNFNSNSTLGIGAAATASPDYPVVGYVSDVRLVKGSSVYDPTSSTLTVPTAPLTAITNTSLLLSYTNAGILDNAMMNDLETVGNAQISTSVKKYGTGSMYFDGVGDYISTVYKPIAQYGSANFTIEFWFYQNSRTAGEYDAIFRINSAGTGYGADMYMTIGAGVSGYALAVSNNARNGWAVLLNPTGGLPALTTWHHMAIVRNGSTWTVYLNGSSVGTATYSGTVNTPSGAFEIGWAGTSDSYFDGYIDDFRITNGVARYTTTFTPPTAAFPDKG